eukprot:scaffold84531_cov56-Phaeocystis_antarctica.AAC.1
MPSALVRHGLEHADGGGCAGGGAGGLGAVGGSGGGVCGGCGGAGGGDGGGGEGANTTTTLSLTGDSSRTPEPSVESTASTAARVATDSAICTVVVSPSMLSLTSASLRLRALRIRSISSCTGSVPPPAACARRRLVHRDAVAMWPSVQPSSAR